MNQRWLLRLARMARQRPSRRRMIMMGVIFGIIAALWGIETLLGWPEWARVQRMR